jgi:hypothetical protein
VACSRLGRKLIAARPAEALILGTIYLLSLLEKLPRDLLVSEVRAVRGVGVQLCAIDRDHPDVDETRLCAKRQHLGEQIRDGVLMITTKARDRRVIGHLVGRDHAVGNILATAALDPSGGTLSTRVRIQQQRDHHRRVIRRPTPPITAMRRIESRQIHLRYRVKDEPREMTLRQPIPHIQRQQKRLLTINRNEVLRHHQMVLNPPDDPGLRDSLDERRSSPTPTFWLSLRLEDAVADGTSIRPVGRRLLRGHRPQATRHPGTW